MAAVKIKISLCVCLAVCLTALGVSGFMLYNDYAQRQNDQNAFEQLDETTKDQAQTMIDDMKTQEGVKDAYYKTKDEAMAEFKERWGENGYLLDGLKDNPLPNSIVIQIADLEKADALAQRAETYEGIEDVKYYKSTVDKLLKATKFMQMASMIIMLFLIIVAVIIVANTIKLTVFNRSDEISIMKYVGATNWFIRGPFLIEGIIIGVISAGITLAIVSIAYNRLVDAIGEQVYSMLSMPMVEGQYLLINFGWILVALGIVIGAIGSIISLRRFLDV